MLNRANGPLPIFTTPDDYAAFERVLEEAVQRKVMPEGDQNHLNMVPDTFQLPKPGQKYSDLHKDYLDGKLTVEEFLKEYRDLNNYWLENQSHNWG